MGNEGMSAHFLDIGTKWQWSSLRFGRFIPWERAPGTHWIGGWVGPKAGLDTVVRRKIPSLYRDSNPRSSSPKFITCNNDATSWRYY